MVLRACGLAVLTFLLCAGLPGGAEAGPAWPDWETATGDWGGARRSLAGAGVQIEAVHTFDYFSNVRGGIRRQGETLDNVDLIFTLDLERLAGWGGATLFIYGLGNHGGDPSASAGDLQVLNNIEAPSAWRLYEAWLQQSLLGTQLSLLAGLYDLNSEFDVISSGKLFINSSHGIGPDYSQSGQNGPSIFPATSLALRARFKPHPWWYVQAAVLDGVPGDLNNPHGVHVHLSREEGALMAVEAGRSLHRAASPETAPERQRHRRIGRFESQDYDGKIAMGAWAYSAPFEDLLDRDGSGEPRERHGNRGVYVLAERVIWKEDAGSRQGLAFFGRAGLADPRFNQTLLYTGAGLVYTGLIPGRPEDQLGLAVAVAHNGSDFKRARQRAGQPVDARETALELTYRAPVTPWLALQPDLQVILDPGTHPALDHALVLGLRVEISF